jgi:hypothetical protein
VAGTSLTRCRFYMARTMPAPPRSRGRLAVYPVEMLATLQVRVFTSSWPGPGRASRLDRRRVRRRHITASFNRKKGRCKMRHHVRQPHLNNLNNMPTAVLSSTEAEIRTPVRAALGERQRLFACIAAHQHACSRYLAMTRPRARAWTVTNIVSSAVAAAVAAGPTFGGSAFLDTIQRGLGLPDDLPLGQILCAVIFAISVVSTITANIIHTRGYAIRIAAAETSYGALDALRVELRFGALPVVRGAEIVAKEIARTPFVIHPQTQ